MKFKPERDGKLVALTAYGEVPVTKEMLASRGLAFTRARASNALVPRQKAKQFEEELTDMARVHYGYAGQFLTFFVDDNK